MDNKITIFPMLRTENEGRDPVSRTIIYGEPQHADNGGDLCRREARYQKMRGWKSSRTSTFTTSPPTIIYFTEDGKRHIYDEYMAGKSPTKIFVGMGLPVSGILGKRARGIVIAIAHDYKKRGTFEHKYRRGRRGEPSQPSEASDKCTSQEKVDSGVSTYRSSPFSSFG